jgi:hypothetical protein
MKIMMSFLLFRTLYCNMNNDDYVIIHFSFMCFEWLNCLDSTIVKIFWKIFSIWKTIWIYNAKSLKRWCRFANCLFALRWQSVETSSTIRRMILRMIAFIMNWRKNEKFVNVFVQIETHHREIILRALLNRKIHRLLKHSERAHLRNLDDVKSIFCRRCAFV